MCRGTKRPPSPLGPLVGLPRFEGSSDTAASEGVERHSSLGGDGKVPWIFENGCPSGESISCADLSHKRSLTVDSAPVGISVLPPMTSSINASCGSERPDRHSVASSALAASSPAPAGEAVVDLAATLTVVGGLGVGGFGAVVLARVSNAKDNGVVKPAARGAVSSAARNHLDVQDPDKESQLYAIKVIPKHMVRRSRARSRLLREIRVSQCIPHSSPFLQRHYCTFETATHVFLINEYYSAGDLFHHLQVQYGKYSCGFSERRVALMVAEIALGLDHLHRLGMVHRDVKIENVVVDAKGHLRIIDFGLAQSVYESRVESRAGSAHYMAPELIQSSIVGVFTDWWALGVLAHELLTGCAPWSTLDDRVRLHQEIIEEPILPAQTLSPNAKALILSLLHRNAWQRLGTHGGAEEIATMPFFLSVDWDATAQRRGEPPIATRWRQPTPSPEALELYKAMVAKERETADQHATVAVPDPTPEMGSLGLVFSRTAPTIQTQQEEEALVTGEL